MSETVTSHINEVPAEIWRIVIENLAGRAQHRDQMYLWNRCRLVSKHFKNAVETFFVRYFLHNNNLRVEAVTCHETPSHWDFRVAGCFETRFNRISDDGNIAIFHAKNQNGGNLLKSYFVDDPKPDWQYCFMQMCMHTQYGNVRIRVNDEGDVEFDWRKLFTANLAERRLCHRPGCGWVGTLVVVPFGCFARADL